MVLIAVSSVYSPPDWVTECDTWYSILNCVDEWDHILFGGDFSAHFERVRFRVTGRFAQRTWIATLARDLISLSDSNIKVMGDFLEPDHLLVQGRVDAPPTTTNFSFRRFNTKSLDWFLFRKRVEDRIPDSVAELRESIRLSVLYEHFMNSIFEILIEIGAYRCNSLRSNRKSQSL